MLIEPFLSLIHVKRIKLSMAEFGLSTSNWFYTVNYELFIPNHLWGKHLNLILSTDENCNVTRKAYSKNKQYSDTSSPRFHFLSLLNYFIWQAYFDDVLSQYYLQCQLFLEYLETCDSSSTSENSRDFLW